MKAKVLIGVAALGGIMLVGSMLGGNKENIQTNTEAQATPEPAVIPTAFQDFPVYPNASISSARAGNTDTSDDASVSLQTTDNSAAVYEWYETALAGNGWNIKSDQNVGGYRIIQSEKENYYTSLQAHQDSTTGLTTISQHMKIRR